MTDEDLKFAFESDKSIMSAIEFNNNPQAYLFISNSYLGDTDILPFNVMGNITAVVSLSGLYINMINQTMPNCFNNFSRIICAQSIK